MLSKSLKNQNFIAANLPESCIFRHFHLTDIQLVGSENERDYLQRHRKVIPIYRWICRSDLRCAFDLLSRNGIEYNPSSKQTEQSCVVCFQVIKIQSFRKLQRTNVRQSLPVDWNRDNDQHMNAIRSCLTSSENVADFQKR
jgi:hypothetical protein